MRDPARAAGPHLHLDRHRCELYRQRRGLSTLLERRRRSGPQPPHRGHQGALCTLARGQARGLHHPERRHLPRTRLRPAHARNRDRRHLERRIQRAFVRLPVERDPRKGRGLRLRLPLPQPAPCELLHLSRPRHRPVPRPHRGRGRLARLVRPGRRHLRGLHCELRLGDGRPAQALCAHQAPQRRILLQDTERQARRAPPADARIHAQRPARAGCGHLAHRTRSARLRVCRTRRD